MFIRKRRQSLKLLSKASLRRANNRSADLPETFGDFI
jgi:hypothetical protein